MAELRVTRADLDGGARLLASTRARLSAAIADLALPDSSRLTEWQLTTLHALLAGLIRGIEDDLRSALAGHFGEEARGPLRAALTSAQLAIALPVLKEAGALDEPGLVSALLRRAEEHRLARASGETALLVELAGDGEEGLASEAMALLTAHSGRLDAFQEPLIGRVELSAEIEHGLVWSVAAALRRYLVVQHGVAAPAADEAIAAATWQWLARYDEGGTIDALSLRVARRLHELGRLDDALTVRALEEAGLPLFLAALAVRTGLDPASVWDILGDAPGRGPALLLRAAGLERRHAAVILLRLLDREEAVLPQLDRFDTLGDDEALQLLGLWRLDPGYRAAIARLAA
jgi:uncharacterized protein (DUF2336 family)